MRHPQFWARLQRNICKAREDDLKEIWEEIERNIDSLHLLLILYKLTKFVGKEKRINS